MKKLLEQTGVTVLEVLITLGIAGIIMTAVFKAYFTQLENHMTQDTITNIQQNARMVIDALARHIREAGDDLPPGLPALVAANTDPDTVTLLFRVKGCEVSLAETMASSGSAIKCAEDVSCLKDNQWVYIFEPESDSGEFFQISAVNKGTRYLYHSTAPLNRTYTDNARIIVIQQLKYFLDNVTNPVCPRLMLQIPGRLPQVFAENISDFQLLYILRNNLVVDQPLFSNEISKVKVSINGQALEPSSTDKDIRYCTRIYSTTVPVSNL